jgi:hypothetical protein
VKKFDCGIIDEELCVARDPEHHYLIKFTLKEGKWMVNKRGIVRIGGSPFPKITMTMGYYKDAPILKMRISDRLLKQLMDYVSSQ